MSWGLTAISKDKEKLKAHARKQLVAYHEKNTEGHDRMNAAADKIDAIIDMFAVRAGQLIRLEASGHLDSGPGGQFDANSGNFKVDVTNYAGWFVE